MNLKEIFAGNKNELDKYTAFYSRQNVGFSSGAAKLTQGKYTLSRLKMKAGHGLMVVPLMIHLSIAPDGSILPTGMPYLGSYRSAISLIKMMARDNNKFAKSLETTLGKDEYAKLNLAAIEEISKDEIDVFWRFRHPLVYQRTVMAVKASDSQFPRTYAVELATDPETGDYIDDPNNPMIWKLYNLEAACLATKVKQMREANDNAGDNMRTEAEMTQAVKNVWNNRCISNPYVLGTTRVQFFETNRNYDITDAQKSKWDSSNGPKNNEYYIKINSKLYNLFESYLGSKYDRYEDFLLIKQMTPEFDKNDQASKARDITRTPAGSDESIERSLTDFIEVYAKYRDNLEMWDDKIIRTSAFEYKTITDSAITDIFKNSMPELSAAMHTAEIADKYSEIIAKVDTNLSNELVSSVLTGDAPEVGDVSAELAQAPVITEDTPGYGGDTLPTGETDTAGMIEALMSSSN